MRRCSWLDLGLTALSRAEELSRHKITSKRRSSKTSLHNWRVAAIDRNARHDERTCGHKKDIRLVSCLHQNQKQSIQAQNASKHNSLLKLTPHQAG